MASLAEAREEADTCRICRAEGSRDEPLFHPCKCSGSIMFVHQDCLMEWLSHSQKKHCELCKTSFTFTKLYHPHMPETLPWGLFLRKASWQVLQSLATWCRALLVACIWLIWLPWSMRFVWWGLYWLADGGWSTNINASIERMVLNATDSSMFTSSKDPSQQSLSSFSGQAKALQKIPWHFVDPRAITRRILPRFLAINMMNSTRQNENFVTNIAYAPPESGRSTLLSGFGFLKTLTHNVFVNNFVMDVLEGQIITLIVVAAFILVFLIREWVVQQQPMINMAALEEAQDLQARENVGRDAAQVDDAAPDESGQSDQDESPHSLRTTLSHFEASQIREIIAELRKSEQETRSSEDSEPPISAAHERRQESDASLILRIRDMIGALENYVNLIKRNEKATETKDLRKFLALLIELDDSLVHLPSTEVQEMREKLRSFRTTLSHAILHASDRPNSELGNANSIEYSQPRDSDSSSSAESVTYHTRPTMSNKLETSLATDIHRSLHENNKNVEENIPDSDFNDLGSKSEGNGTDSPESWQMLPSPTKEHTEGATLEAAATDQYQSHSGFNALDDYSFEEAPHDNEPVMRPQIGRQKTTQSESVSLAKSTPDSTIVPAPEVEHVSSAGLEDSTLNQSSLNPDGILVNDVAGSAVPVNDAALQMNQSGPNNSQPSTSGHGSEQGMDKTLLNRVFDWLWGEMEPSAPEELALGDDEQIVQNVAEEAPFVPFANAQPGNVQDAVPNDGDVPQHAPAVDANPAEAEQVEDAEDLEGLMELVGMQGNIAGLFQNAIFMSVVVSATIASAVWFPFLFGKGVIVLLAHPLDVVELPVRLLSIAANFFVDGWIVVLASLVHWSCRVLQLLGDVLFRGFPWPFSLDDLAAASSKVTDGGLFRIGETFASFSETAVSESGRKIFDSLSTLRLLENSFVEYASRASSMVSAAYLNLQTFFGENTNLFHSIGTILLYGWQLTRKISQEAMSLVWILPRTIWSSEITLSFTSHSKVILEKPDLLEWRATDRFLATCVGYGFFASVAVLYVAYLAPLARSRSAEKIETILLGVMDQAGGVLKVILIISIEMLAFPFYCGMLLDIALLPCFAGATLETRVAWTKSSPWTSIFLHWFIGTCYMFHFALFVSMCRKMLRNGVLYFIRDPDDPNFHPVRDVLERPVITQLRKIGSSAVIYGGLVLFCLGSIVWTIAYSSSTIMPIRWASQSARIRYMDLLLYTLVKPMAIRYLTPTGAAQKACEWWFRKCAHRLRLSSFLFDERSTTEEPLPDPITRRIPANQGRFARVPATDQVRIPRGCDAFLEVDSENNRIDGKPDHGYGLHGRDSGNYKLVYIPPHYNVRIALFATSLWILVACAGLSITLTPLLLGRSLFASFILPEVPINDIYAYSLGFTILASSVFAVQRYKNFVKRLKLYRSRLTSKVPKFNNTDISTLPSQASASALTFLDKLVFRTIRILYTYTSICVFIPMLFALLIEAYLVGPLQAYVSAGKSPHAVNFVTDWVFGVQLLRIAVRGIRWDEQSRISRASREIFVKGWLDPDIRTLTRGFLLPACISISLLLTVPLPFGYLASALRFRATSVLPLSASDRAMRVQIFRFAYPSLLLACLTIWGLKGLVGALDRWRMRIRDEVYLIGERLHNFGEKRPPSRFGTQVGGSRVRD